MKTLISVISSEVENARHIIPMTAANERETEARIAACANIANALADRLAKAQPIYDINGNRRFDRAWFLKVCGVAR